MLVWKSSIGEEGVPVEALEIGKRSVVLFDFDGTVADTGRAVMTSTRKTLAVRGF